MILPERKLISYQDPRVLPGSNVSESVVVSRIEFPAATLENAEQGVEVCEIALLPKEGVPTAAEIPAHLRYIRASAQETQ